MTEKSYNYTEHITDLFTINDTVETLYNEILGTEKFCLLISDFFFSYQ